MPEKQWYIPLTEEWLTEKINELDLEKLRIESEKKWKKFVIYKLWNVEGIGRDITEITIIENGRIEIKKLKDEIKQNPPDLLEKLDNNISNFAKSIKNGIGEILNTWKSKKSTWKKENSSQNLDEKKSYNLTKYITELAESPEWYTPPN